MNFKIDKGKAVNNVLGVLIAYIGIFISYVTNTYQLGFLAAAAIFGYRAVVTKIAIDAAVYSLLLTLAVIVYRQQKQKTAAEAEG